MVSQIIRGWLHTWQFQQALKQGKFNRANYLLKKLESSKNQLPWVAKLYQQKLKAERSENHYKQETDTLNQRLQNIASDSYLLKPNLNFIEHIHNTFKFTEHDNSKLQITGIDRPIFNELEIALSNFLETEINKVSCQHREAKLQEAIDDLLGLKKGIDPNYSYFFSPHVYLLKYFTENVYCTYLAWFLVYQSGLLPKNIKILDVAAGPGTVIYGLALLLLSTVGYHSLQPLHISYYSLEQQATLQYRGLQFWRSYIESIASPLNAYFRFNTLNIFDYQDYAAKLPKSFFNCIVISHCFFYNPQQRHKSHQIYRQIFHHNLQPEGYVLLIIQGRKLFNIYDILPTENMTEEEAMITMFLEELGLKLEWYKYLTSTGKRTPIEKGFSKFARENLPSQHHIGNLRKKYLQEFYVANYCIDDYVILAKKSPTIF
ncbi:conserved hypothetical protein [Hyella patelloides LEGE 07179]|uniref:Photosystem II assembly protein n=1 Tax=Hyella patelloides LEGE 07179 TaxID=945734 RepID=A0A563W5J2_9CYAN|nr:photosystem II assembly protein [Hyella patelloides]VEP18917.1 conserved hypothetical protein [Hyella patelloides LEGE 07179]